MALLNGYYVHVTSETIEHGYAKTNNPVEEGVDLTDHIERNLIKLKLQGTVIDTPKLTAGKMYSQLQIWAKEGTIIKFSGRNIIDAVITNVSKTSKYEISNGAEITIELEEIRFAKSPYTAPSENAGTQQVKTTADTPQEVWHTVQKGDTLYGIAKKYGTTLSWILANNKVPSGNPNLIYVGEKYLVSTTGVSNTTTVKTTTKSTTNKTTTTKKTTTTTKKASTTQTTNVVYETSASKPKVNPEDITPLVPDENVPGYVEIDPNYDWLKIKDPIPNDTVAQINDKISRLRDYMSYFKGDANYPYYKEYVGYIEYDLKIIEDYTHKNIYTPKTAKKNLSQLKSAIDNCHKAKGSAQKIPMNFEYLDENRKKICEIYLRDAMAFLNLASQNCYKYMYKRD